LDGPGVAEAPTRAVAGTGRAAISSASSSAQGKPANGFPPAAAPADRRREIGQPEAHLDSHWERRIKAGSASPDSTIDLHGLSLAQAHARLQDGIGRARAAGVRIVLVIAGKERKVAAADRGSSRGAIRAKLLDWLAAGPHAEAIAAIRNAHRQHGGEGALYVVLKRER
jgi:DNA-nicking Smr family endonuclease